MNVVGTTMRENERGETGLREVLSDDEVVVR